MKPLLRILYLGDNTHFTASTHRAEALRRIGCEVTHINPFPAYGWLRIHPKFHHLSGFRLAALLTYRWLEKQIAGNHFDLVWTNQCCELSTQAIRLLRERFGAVITYVNDDPTGTGDGRRFGTFKKALPEYSLCVAVRPDSELEFQAAGAHQTTRVWMSYDEVAHAPLPAGASPTQKFQSDVAFIGTWFRHEARDDFLLQLIRAKIPVSIWGDRWQKSPLWSQLAPCWRGPALRGADYVAAIQGAKICLGLLSKENRDLHTQRSAEIPYAGGLLCAERTSEHRQMYQEGEEAVFWSNAKECIQACQRLLADEPLRERIRLAGMRRIRELGFGNETICRHILHVAGFPLSAAQPHHGYRMAAQLQ